MKTFKAFLLEKLMGTLKPEYSTQGDVLEKYYINPTTSEINTIYKTASTGTRGYIRGIVMSDGDLYVWAGHRVNHYSAVDYILDTEDVNVMYISPGEVIIKDNIPILVAIDKKYGVWLADSYNSSKISPKNKEYVDSVFKIVKTRNKWIHGFNVSPIKNNT